MPETHTNSLLLEIQMAVRCPYLSDLGTYCHLLDKQMTETILAIPIERYSLKEWNAALAYITKESKFYKTVEDAKRKITEG